VAGGFGPEVVVWDAVTGQVLARMKHGKMESSPSFSLDGRRVISASTDGTLRVWDTHWLALGRQQLIDAVCREKLQGAKSLSARDAQATIILRGREGEDVCAQGRIGRSRSRRG
jgi:WD40 repeat protein